MEIWLNPACSKCRTATETLDAAGVSYTVRRYLEDPPTPAELTEVLRRLGLEPWDIARLGESVAGELDLTGLSRDDASRADWIKLLTAHPILIQRPILTAADGTTVVGRTSEELGRALAGEH
jgi:arsenate reductase